MKFIRQMDYNGLGHAIDQAKDEFPEDESVLIVLGDIIFTADIAGIIGSSDNMIGIMQPDDPRKYGIVTVDAGGYITNMVEKPENPSCNLAIGGLYYFKSAYRLFESLKFIIDEEIKTKDEYQLTDAMKTMINRGEKFKIFNIPEWYDCGEKETLLKTNRVMLEKLATHDNIPGSIIKPPVFIGHNTRIENSIIGPYVSISDNSCVKNALITNSILGFETVVENTILDSSLVGDNSFLSEGPREFNVGPDSEIIFTK
jgi:glucose-1-phosphate thymidylyltransferase